MKNLLLLLLLFIFCSTAKSQMPTNDDYTDWNWEDSSAENWKREKNGVWSTIISPFNSSMDRVNLIYEINRNQDFTYQKGWRLVHANFRGSFPYFILYNINSSLLRGFIFIEGDAGLPYTNSIVMTITPNSNLKTTKLFHLGESLQYAVNDKSAESVFSQNSLSATTTAGLNSWTALEIPLLFDPTMTSLNTNWTIEFFSGSLSNFSMSINGTSVPMDANGNLLFSHPAKSSNAINTDSFSKLHTQIKNISDWGDKLQSNADKIALNDNTPGFLRTYKNLAGSLGNTIKVAGAISQISSGLEVALGIFNFFLGGSSSASIPSGYSHSFNGEGSISSLLYLRANTMSVPGSLNANIPIWGYNCPMGVINLTNTPTVKKTVPYLYTTLNKHEKNGLFCKSGCLLTKDTRGNYILDYYECPFNGLGNASKHTCQIPLSRTNFVQYKLYDNIDLSVKTGINIIETKYALICKEDNESNITTRFFPASFRYGSYGIFSVVSSTPNPIYTNLENENYVLYEYDKINKIFIYGTPYMSINELRNINFETISTVKDINLGVQVKYTVTGDSEPRYFKGTYKVNIEEETINETIFIGGDRPQATFLTTPYPAQSRINYFTYNCDNNTSLRSTNILNEEILENQIYLTPNPTNGILTFRNLDNSKSCSIQIYTLSGKFIYSKENILDGQIIDLTLFPKGVYIANIKSEDGVKTEKIIIK